MEPLPYRTYATSLSDDELILFDTFWYGSTWAHLLYGEFFLEQWNLGYKHALSDEQLCKTIWSLFGRGLLTLWKDPCSRHNRLCVSLTDRGGELWSTERCPVWHRWATDSYRETRRGKNALALSTLSRDTLDNLTETGTATHLWDISNARIRPFQTIPNYRLVPWAPACELHVLIAIGLPDDSEREFDANWQLWNQKRQFWRGVPELQKFLPTDIPTE